MADKTLYTPGIREVIRLSRVEAVRLDTDYISPEHLLLGILRAGKGIAFQVLQILKTDIQSLKTQLEDSFDRKAWKTHLYRPDANGRRVLESMKSEALKLNHTWIGTEHLLLSLIATDDTFASRCLAESNITYEAAQQEIIRIIGSCEAT